MTFCWASDYRLELPQSVKVWTNATLMQNEAFTPGDRYSSNSSIFSKDRYKQLLKLPIQL
jgi:hypothetical protein